jgi:predicted RNA methylase
MEQQMSKFVFPGHLSKWHYILQDCSKVTAVDPNLSMEPYAKENARLYGLKDFKVVEGVAEQLPFEDATFDRAVCTLVMPFASHTSLLGDEHVSHCKLDLLQA